MRIAVSTDGLDGEDAAGRGGRALQRAGASVALVLRVIDPRERASEESARLEVSIRALLTEAQLYRNDRRAMLDAGR